VRKERGLREDGREWGNILIDAGKYNKIFSKGFFL
jgi:hypothetical protein